MKMGLATSILLTTVLVAMPATGQQRETPRVFIEASETVDASNSDARAKQVDFGTALSAALVKKKTPVTVVTDKSKSTWSIQSVSAQKEDSTGTKVMKIIAFGGFAGSFTKFEGTIRVVDNETSAVLFAYNVKKSNFQSAAEAFAKHFKNDYLDKRR
jgi:hypothetical protein